MTRTHALSPVSRGALALAVAAVGVSGALAAGATAAAAARPDTYTLTGDPAGSRFEGIGADQRRGTFYVSEVTGGEVHRGTAGSATTAEWLAGDGTDGRWTARGITVDRAGRVYVAGGPNGLDHPGAPDLWVYSPAGELLAALRMPATDVFLNDVVVGPDGAVYATNSNDPEVFRVARGTAGWTADLWVDATGTVTRQPGFNLGGIEVAPDDSALVVAQGSTGQLWRVDLTSRAVTEVAGGVDVTNADGLVARGDQLTVVQNFTRAVATLELADDGSSARLLHREATDPERVLTTAALLDGRLLLVDSEFGPEAPDAPYEVVTRAWAR